MLPQQVQCHRVQICLSGKKRVMLWRERKQSSSFPNPRRPGSPDGPADLEELLKPKRTSKESDALGEGQCQHSDPQEATGSRKRKMGDFQRKFVLSSIAQSCPTLCDPMSGSTPGLPVHHQQCGLKERNQTVPESWDNLPVF